MISSKGGKFYFHASIRALVFLHLLNIFMVSSFRRLYFTKEIRQVGDSVVSRAYKKSADAQEYHVLKSKYSYIYFTFCLGIKDDIVTLLLFLYPLSLLVV